MFSSENYFMFSRSRNVQVKALKGIVVNRVLLSLGHLKLFKTGSTLKCRYALGLDFSALTHLYFSVALDMYILALYSTCC